MVQTPLSPIRRITTEDLLARNYPGGVRDAKRRFDELVKDVEPHSLKGSQYRELIDHPGFQDYMQWVIEQQNILTESIKSIDMPTDKRIEAVHQLVVYETVIQRLVDVIKKGDSADKEIQDGEAAVDQLKQTGG